MHSINYIDIVTPELEQGAIHNNEHPGFHEDYLLLHCLLKIVKPKRFLEIGTNMGVGTNIIKNALGPDSEVFSLDLPKELCHQSLQHPIMEGKGDNVGVKCTLPFIQLRGDSLTFDYLKLYPINGWFIDGEHVYQNVFIESTAAFNSNAEIIIWHDTDIPEVYRAIIDAHNNSEKYILYRVQYTRISYAVHI